MVAEASSPTVFVGVPTLRRPGLVRQTLESLVHQTRAPDRVLVSDDGSSEPVRDEVSAFVRSLSLPHCHFHAQPKPAFEYGQGRFLFEATKGSDYFVILHDDDLLAPSYLQVAVATLQADPTLACFITQAGIIDAEGKDSDSMSARYDLEHGRQRFPAGKLPILGPLMESGLFPISGTVFRRRCLEEVGFVSPDIEGNFPFELDLLMRLGAAGHSGYLHSERLIRFRYHDESLRNRLWFNRSIIENLIRLLRKFRFEGKLERRRKKLLGFNHRRLAAIQLTDGENSAARQEIASAVRTNPISWKNLALWPCITLVPGLTRPFLSRRVLAERARGRPAESPARENALRSIRPGTTL